jgi:TonB-dependent starch-binding outer membrane protein SusC
MEQDDQCSELKYFTYNFQINRCYMMKLNALLRSVIAIAIPLLLSLYSYSQNNFRVSGKVIDQAGKPVEAVTVTVKGNSTNATVTKADGSFELNVPSSNSTLVFSSVGFGEQEVAVNGQPNLSVTLSTVASSLEDLVVVGYGTRKRTDVTGAVASINSEKIRSIPTTNVTTALQGRIAGIEATASSWRPGSGARIRIRGNRSLSASNDPLYVVDGIPVTYTIDDMNPSDIESIDVLKDASATAIYGVRGANGVVQITTKKGKAGKVTVDYNGSVSLDNMLMDLPVFNGPQMVDMWRQAFSADGAYIPTGGIAAQNQYFPNALIDQQKLFTDANMWAGMKDAYTFRFYNSPTSFATVKRAATQQEKDLMKNLGMIILDSLDLYDPSKIRSYDWQDKFKRQGITNSQSITLTAGSEKIRASFSGAYFNQKGIDPGQNYIRYTVGNNTEFRPAKFITFGNSISYSNSTQNISGIYGAASGMIPIVEPYDANGNFLLFPNGDRQIPSPANNLGRVINETKVSRIFGNVYGEVTILPGLRYKAVFGIDSRNARQGTFNGTNTSAQLDAPANASYAITNSISWVYDNLLFYNFSVKRDHNFNITLLHELQSLNKQDQLTMSANNLIFEEQKWYSLQRNTNATVNGSGTYTASQLASYMGRLEYGFKNKYLLTLSNRYDNSSVLAEGKKGEFFPSAAFAWQINNENFFANQNIFDYAKIRIGIGRVGNSSIAPYQTNGPLDFTNYNWGNGNAAIGTAPATFPVPNLTWEKTTTKNLGLEFGVLKNRINMVVDLYESSTKDMLQTRQIPATNGVNYILMNLGEVSNKGIDVSLSTVNLNTKSGLRWTTDIVFSKNKEAIVDIDGTGNDNLANLWFIGKPIRVYYNYESNGIYQYSDTMKGGYLADYLWLRGSNKSNLAYRAGRIRVADKNGDTLINNDDKMILGTDNADWTGSITNTVSFKGFELSAMLYIRKGGMYRAPRPGLVGRFQSNYVNYWTPTNPSNEYQQPTRTSDVPVYWEALGYRDGSFARIRNISLTYRFGQSILSKLKANSLAVYVNAVNPFLFHTKSDYDPETIPYAEQFTATTNNTGPNSFSYRSVVFGVRLGL